MAEAPTSSIGILVSDGGDAGLVRDFLAAKGHGVVTLASLIPDDLDLVLVDEECAEAKLPQLLAAKRSAKPGYLPILVLGTANTRPARWIDAGLDDVLRRPLPKAEFAARLQPHLRLRRQQAEATAGLEARFRATLDLAPVGIGHFRPDGILLRANKRLAEMLGGASPDLTGNDFSSLVGSDDAREAFRAVAESGTASVCEFAHSRGDHRTHLRFSFWPTQPFNGFDPYVVVTAEDQTRQRLQIEALAEMNERLTTLARSSPLPIWTLNVDGRVEGMNEAAKKIFGAMATAHGGWIPPREFEAHRAAFSRALAGEIVHGFRTHRRLANGDVVELSISKAPIRGNAGEVTGVISIAMDVTADVRAAAALRGLNEELESRVQQRTAELREANDQLESFVGSVSHDLRAPVNVIRGFTEQLISRTGMGLSPDASNLILRVHGAAARMNEIIDGLLALSRTRRAVLLNAQVDLSAIARDIFEDMRAGAPERAVELAVEAGLETRGDPRLLRLAMENLLRNAWKYSAYTPRARIEFGRSQGEFFIRDNGAGFDARFVDRLFKPFERLHSEREFPGVGMGLATVAAIISRHGGRIRAMSEEGAGAEFRFMLPGLP